MASNPPIDLAPEQIRRLKRVEYDRLVALGVLGEERIELLYGFLVHKKMHDPLHTYAIVRLNEVLVTSLSGRARVHCQCPFAASDESEPEPDFTVVGLDAPTDEHPQKILLAVEVSNSSLKFDRKTKARLYAESEVPEFWIVNVVDRLIEVHTQAAGGRWTKVETVPHDGAVSPAAFPDLVVRVADVIR